MMQLTCAIGKLRESIETKDQPCPFAGEFWRSPYTHRHADESSNTAIGCSWTKKNWLQHCLGRIPLIFSFLRTQLVRWSQSFQHSAIQNRNIPDYTLQDHLLNTCHKVAQLLIIFSTNWRHLAKFFHLLLSEVMFVHLSESLEAGKTPTSDRKSVV